MMSFNEARAIFQLPFFVLLEKARLIYKQNFDPSKIQMSALYSIQTGGCSEDCAYCAQSIKNKTKIAKQDIADLSEIIDAARTAKEMGSSRFCMAASGRQPSEKLFDIVCQAVREVKKLGLETCLTVGFLSEEQIKTLKDTGLDYYNHNIDTSPAFYDKIITTRTIDERIATIKLVQKYDIKVCSGGILGLGENNEDRIKMLLLLANLSEPPQSVPINKLVRIPGTDLENAEEIDKFDFVRTISLARILMPKSYVRLSAGREEMSDELQALCFFAGANSIFIGEKLLTVNNSKFSDDQKLLQKLGLEAE